MFNKLKKLKGKIDNVAAMRRYKSGNFIADDFVGPFTWFYILSCLKCKYKAIVPGPAIVDKHSGKLLNGLYTDFWQKGKHAFVVFSQRDSNIAPNKKLSYDDSLLLTLAKKIYIKLPADWWYSGTDLTPTNSLNEIFTVFDDACVNLKDMFEKNATELTEKEFYKEVGKTQKMICPKCGDIFKVLQKPVYDRIPHDAAKHMQFIKDLDVSLRNTGISTDKLVEQGQLMLKKLNKGKVKPITERYE